MEFGCEFVICVTSGKGFQKDKVYPVLGTNNGIHILREGDFNNWDDSGAPSFNGINV